MHDFTVQGRKSRFAGQVMLDPYAHVAGKVYLPEGVNVPPPSKGIEKTEQNVNPPAYMGCLGALAVDYDWEETRPPRTPLEQTVVLELDVLRFSNSKVEVHPYHQGRLSLLCSLNLWSGSSVLSSFIHCIDKWLFFLAPTFDIQICIQQAAMLV